MGKIGNYTRSYKTKVSTMWQEYMQNKLEKHILEALWNLQTNKLIFEGNFLITLTSVFFLQFLRFFLLPVQLNCDKIGSSTSSIGPQNVIQITAILLSHVSYNGWSHSMELGGTGNFTEQFYRGPFYQENLEQCYTFWCLKCGNNSWEWNYVVYW